MSKMQKPGGGCYSCGGPVRTWKPEHEWTCAKCVREINRRARNARMANEINIRIDLDPDNSPLQFSTECMIPILEWRGQMGWVLQYVEADGNNGDYYLGGSLDDLDRVLAESRKHLADVELT